MNINDVLKKISKSKQIILWGYSFLGKRVEQYLQENNIQINIYWDSNAENLKIENKNLVLPGTDGDLDAQIITCIGNNLLRERLINEMNLKGYINFLDETELHILFKQVLNKKYNHFCCDIFIRNMTQKERLEAAISSAINNNFEMWERQFEYVERLRIAEKINILGSYNEACFCKKYLYDNNGIKNITAYIDGNENGIEDYGLKHSTIQQLDYNALYIIMSHKYSDYLTNGGIWYCDFRDLTQNVFTEHHNSKFFESEKEKILDAYMLLEDEQSKDVYVETICNRIAPQYSVKTFEELEDGLGYFDNGIFELSDEEYYVDAGAYTGDSVLDFIHCVNNKYRKIYAFELDPDNFKKMCNNLSLYNNERLDSFCLGLYDKEIKVTLRGGDSGIYISDKDFDNNGFAKVVPLDSILKDKQVTLLKMDIEGSELHALKGAKEIISNQKPNIAISAYHKLEDIWQIPLYLKELNPEYHCYIRHHGPYTWDTDLYLKV